jgi:hypothetical protein
VSLASRGVTQKLQLPILLSKIITFSGKIDGMSVPEAINEISDFSNASDTIQSLFSKYCVPGMSGSLSKTSTPDVSLRNLVQYHQERKSD